MNAKDAASEERIYNEVIVDANGPEERAMGWYYYLDDKISFPFYAVCTAKDKRIPLELGERVAVVQMSGENHCEHDMFVDISWNEKVLAIPLALIKSVEADEDTVEAIDDWHYWIKRGFSF